MTIERSANSRGEPGRSALIEPRAHTLRFQGLANRIVRVLARTPGICRIVGRRLVVVQVIGRTSGRVYTVRGPRSTRRKSGGYGWVAS